MPITQAQIYWNDSNTPVSNDYNDVYFSNVDGLAETRYVFLEKNQIPARWLNFNKEIFVIAETGFGTGLNFLATCCAFMEFRKKHSSARLKKLHFISIEKFPLCLSDLQKSHQNWAELLVYSNALIEKYPPLTLGCHPISLNENITLSLWFNDVSEAIPAIAKTENCLVDAWYLDGFAPSKNPDMWQKSLFDAMAKLAQKEGSVATFTAAGFVRRGLESAGFAMQKTKGFGTKREMLFGVKK